MRSSSSPRTTKQPAEHLLAVLSITQKLNSERGLSALLTLVARETARLLDAELASLFLLDAQRGELWSRVTLDTEEPLRFDASQGIAGEALRSGQIVRVDDVSRDPRFFQGVDFQTGHRTRSLLAVPLRDARGQSIGVFEVLNKRSGAFTDADVELAQLLAVQISLALETAQLVGDMRRDHRALVADNALLQREVQGRFAARRILGASPQIREAVRLIEQVADSTVSVLITGESGTGKELAAKAIHYGSPRARRPLIALNCAALPEALVESELFGIEKGVATGVEPRPGKFEDAHESTLLLDEIGDLSLPAQAKLLRVLQERVVERVGGRRPIPVDVRVLAATNKDLATAVRTGGFREDLYYRLNVIQIHLPPLRDIAEDIPLLAGAYLAEHCRELHRPPPVLTREALLALGGYRWPGNVRELSNEMRRLAVTVPSDTIAAGDLAAPIRAAGLAASPIRENPPLKDAVVELERTLIAQALVACGNNQQQAARALGLSRQGLIKKLKRYGMLTRPAPNASDR